MTKITNTNAEMLDMEQLDKVSGGWHYQNSMDKEFFQMLGYDMKNISIEDAFLDNGVRFDENKVGNNGYEIFYGSTGTFGKIPHWAAMGYVLSKRKTPDFKGSWTDSKYVCSYLKSNFGFKEF